MGCPDRRVREEVSERERQAAHAEGTFYDIVPKVLTLIAGGQAPDVVRTGNYTTAEFGVRDALVPLNSLIKNDASSELERLRAAGAQSR